MFASVGDPDPHVFSLLDPDPDPLVKGTDLDLAMDQDPSLICGSGSAPKCHGSPTLVFRPVFS